MGWTILRFIMPSPRVCHRCGWSVRALPPGFIVQVVKHGSLGCGRSSARAGVAELRRRRSVTMFVYETDPRRAWRQWCIASVQWRERYEQFLQSYEPFPPGLVLQRRALSRWLMAQHMAEQAVRAEIPPFPEVCRDMTCGARTRKGTPCQRRDLYGHSARCALHGGLSTGPRTVEGKYRAALNGLRPKQKRTP